MGKYPLTLLGQTIWEDRYALKGPDGKLLENDILDTFKRVSVAIASKEKDHTWADKFYDVMAQGHFCPAGRILAHSGTHYSQLLNCFVLPFRADSLEEIMHTASDMAIVQKFGGGCIGGESVVITNKGPIPIKKIVEDNDPDLKVLSYDEKTGKMEYCAILDRHTTPLSGDRVYEISFGARSKAKMRASDWHPFFAFDGDHVVQVRADELKPGMVVIGSTDFSNGYDAWGWLLGYVAGDGAVSPNGSEDYTRIRIVDDKESCISRAAEIMNVQYDLSKDPRYQVDVWACDAYADMATKIKEEFGGHQVCQTKHVPKSLWESSPERRFSFLVGYLDADGWFNPEKERFEAFSVSKTLIYEIAALAGSLGVRATIRFRTAKRLNESDGWEIRFSKSRIFYEAVVPLSAKYTLLDTGWACGSVPLSSVWKEKLRDAGISVNTREAWRDKVTIDGSDSSLVNWLQRGVTTRETAAAILRTCGQDLLAKSVLSSQVVRCARPTGVPETLYDLTVDKNQTYVASDPSTGAFVVVHNTGFNYTRLRPAGSYIKGVNGRSCGVIGFLGMMSTISEVIEQGGSRRGASLGLLEVGHPDVWEFLSYKSDHNWDRMLEFMDVKDSRKWAAFKFENLYKWQMYNVSVGVNDEFLNAVKNGMEWNFGWKDTPWQLYTVKFHAKAGFEEVYEVTADCEETAMWKAKKKVPYPGFGDKFEVTNVRTIKAKELWDRLCYNAWADGCPGLINLSTVRMMHPLEYCHPVESANPCAEQMLPAGAVCLLASLILDSFVIDGKVDYGIIGETVRMAIRFMDDVIDNCEYPFQYMKDMELSERRIGLGTMGVHDMLMKMGYGYDTIEGREIVDSVLRAIRDSAYRASIEIAKEKGSFPAFDKVKFLNSGFIKTLPQDIRDDIVKYGIRNGAILSQAPTGTIATMLNKSTGCEPWFDLSYQRNTRLGSYEDGCDTYLQWKNANPGKDKPSYFKTSQDIKPDDHIAMMVLFSKYVDSAVSKTINLPKNATVEDVSHAYLTAMGNGVKGITVFRDGCKEGVLVKKVDPVAEEDEEDLSLENGEIVPGDSRQNPRKRGDRTIGATTRVNMGTHNMYVTVNRNGDGHMVEVFATVGESKNPKVHHTSGIEDSWAEGLGKIVSLALRAGVEPKSIIRNLKNIPSDKPLFATVGDSEHSELLPSPPHAVARVMEEEMKYIPNTDKKVEDKPPEGERCRKCGSTDLWWRSPTCYECRNPECLHTTCLS